MMESLLHPTVHPDFLSPSMMIRAFLLCFLLLAPASHSAEYFVSPAGNDQAAGTKGAPLATVARGLEKLRGRHGAAGTLWLKDGVYSVNETLSFEAGDEDITIRALNTGKARLDASRRVPEESWVMSEDTRIDAAVRGKVVQLDLGKLGAKQTKQFPERFNDGGGLLQLFAGDVWQPLSRWPNEHNTVMTKVLDRGDDPGAPGKRPGAFLFSEDRPSRWKASAEAGQLWLAGFWRVAWDWQSVRVKELDLEKKSIALAVPIAGGIGSKYAGPEGAGTEPWRAINLVEEIDMPGEWAIDFGKQQLYWWPPSESMKSRVTVADMDGPVFRLRGAKRITLQGLVITGTLGNAIEISDGEACAVVGCEIFGVGKNGVVIKGGTAHRVQTCEMHMLGHGGILLGGGVRETLTPCGHVADNNHIHHYALSKKIWSPGIACGANDAGYACGCIVTHNLIHDSPHAAITYGGNDHRIEFNEVHDFLIESDDLGGFYTNNGWCSHGNVLRCNFIHHTRHALGIYLDDADSGDTVEGNVMYRMGTGAAIGGGHYNTLRNNIAIECPGGFAIDARGVSRKYDQDSAMLRDYRKLNPVNPPWSARFPSLSTLLQDNPALPIGCVLERNIVVGTTKAADLRGKPEHFKFVSLKDNASLTLDDMDFKDVEKLDFRMAKDASAFRKVPGFAAISFEKIGVYKDKHRVRLPAHPSGHSTSEWHRKSSDRR
jgi:parallel beta-helix repeat protein